MRMILTCINMPLKVLDIHRGGGGEVIIDKKMRSFQKVPCFYVSDCHCRKIYFLPGTLRKQGRVELLCQAQ